MASEWPVYRLGDLVEIYDGPHATPKKTDDGPVFLGIWNLSNGRLDLSETEHLSKDDFVKWSRRVTPSAGDVVFSYETRLGEAAAVPPGLRCCLGRRMGLLRPKDGSIDSSFLLYAYLGPEFQDTIRERTIHGSTVERISLIELPEFPIRVPDITEQKAIAGILSALDGKIELNRKMNETLEAMARALFKSWFVDFDPVRAKAEGRSTGLPDHISALFPDSFEDSPLDEIPKGWSVEPISNLTEAVGGSTPSTKEADYWSSEIHAWATPKDLSTLQSPVLLKTERRISEQGLAQIGSGLLPVGTVLMSSRAPIGYLAITQIPVAINQGFIAMKPKGNVSNLFLLYWAECSQELIRSRANGSTFLEISKSSFREIDVVRPSAKIVEKFDEIARPWYQQIVNNEIQSATLRTTRDLLLPKLISGEIRLVEKDSLLVEGIR